MRQRVKSLTNSLCRDAVGGKLCSSDLSASWKRITIDIPGQQPHTRWPKQNITLTLRHVGSWWKGIVSTTYEPGLIKEDGIMVGGWAEGKREEERWREVRREVYQLRATSFYLAHGSGRGNKPHNTRRSPQCSPRTTRLTSSSAQSHTDTRRRRGLISVAATWILLRHHALRLLTGRRGGTG
ncbi:hypothetical protein O3P69_020512 [Scylla paramamosain]|uniref:Uncharacterized protein n=1 Tax=Scylla paramamosain TaxID=85552 RepID=A0AAW0TM29_SCYPA